MPAPRLIVADARSPYFYVTDEELDAWLDYERAYSFVREAKVNDSPEIRVFQQFTGNAPPDSWCASFQSYCIYRVWPHFPLRKSASCQAIRTQAALLKWLLPRGSKPERGDLGFVIDVAKDHAHHIFAVSSDAHADYTFNSAEGNTNPAGGREGYGVFERTTRRWRQSTTTYEFARFPRYKAVVANVNSELVGLEGGDIESARARGEG